MSRLVAALSGLNFYPAWILLAFKGSKGVGIRNGKHNNPVGTFSVPLSII
jgi:hypothetical protein